MTMTNTANAYSLGVAHAEEALQQLGSDAPCADAADRIFDQSAEAGAREMGADAWCDLPESVQAAYRSGVIDTWVDACDD